MAPWLATWAFERSEVVYFNDTSGRDSSGMKDDRCRQRHPFFPRGHLKGGGMWRTLSILTCIPYVVLACIAYVLMIITSYNVMLTCVDVTEHAR